MAKKEKPKVEYRIGKLAFSIAFSFAAMVDLLQLGLDFLGIGGIINPFIITPLTYLSFWTWFMFRGIKLGSRKNNMTILIGTLIEMIPYVDLLPGIAVMVTRIIITSRIEDFAAQSNTLVGKAVKTGTQAVNKYGGEFIPEGKPGSTVKAPTQADINQPTRPPTNIANISSIQSPQPLNLAAPRDQYREAA